MLPTSLSAVRGRLAPSPTGRLHLGNAYAFLAAWLRARSQGGSLILRMEDIDPERSRQHFAEHIHEDLAWIGISWDEGPDRGGPYAPYVQSARMGRYSALLEELESRGLVYPCYCTRKDLRMLATAPHVGDEGVPYPGTCRSLSPGARLEHERKGRKPCLRLDTAKALHSLQAGAAEDSGGILGFDDAVLGPQRFSALHWGGDFALRRSDGVVAYQLAVAADDAAMGVTEVVRGEDLLSSTPRQILLFRLMGMQAPAYAHLPLLHDASGARLAKRHTSLAIGALRQRGVPPEAVTGYLGYLAGWQKHPYPASPAGLLPGFSLAAVAGRRMRLPDDPWRAIAAVCR